VLLLTLILTAEFLIYITNAIRVKSLSKAVDSDSDFLVESDDDNANHRRKDER